MIFFNPAQTLAWYEIELGEAEAGVVELLDVLGNVVKQVALKAGMNKAEFDLGAIAGGVYVYKVTINNEFRSSDKLVITK